MFLALLISVSFNSTNALAQTQTQDYSLTLTRVGASSDNTDSNSSKICTVVVLSNGQYYMPKSSGTLVTKRVAVDAFDEVSVQKYKDLALSKTGMINFHNLETLYSKVSSSVRSSPERHQTNDLINSKSINSFSYFLGTTFLFASSELGKRLITNNLVFESANHLVNFMDLLCNHPDQN